MECRLLPRVTTRLQRPRLGRVPAGVRWPAGPQSRGTPWAPGQGLCSAGREQGDGRRVQSPSGHGQASGRSSAHESHHECEACRAAGLGSAEMPLSWRGGLRFILKMWPGASSISLTCNREVGSAELTACPRLRAGPRASQGPGGPCMCSGCRGSDRRDTSDLLSGPSGIPLGCSPSHPTRNLNLVKHPRLHVFVKNLQSLFYPERWLSNVSARQSA